MPAKRTGESAKTRTSRRARPCADRPASSVTVRVQGSPKAPTDLKDLHQVLAAGEGPTLEFKRSTGELKEGLQTVCAFLNDSGGMVLFGVRQDGRPEGQQVSDSTIRDIAQAVERFEPPVNLSPRRLSLGSGREIIILCAEGTSDAVPFTYEGRPYERVGTTTRKMPQAKYERLLLQRGHAKRRWENLPAEDLTLKDLDRREILRTRELAIQQNRISPDTSRSIADILDRLGLRRNGILTQAAQVLYGTDFLANYPQCLLKMGRFRGTEVTGEIVDNRQEHMHAFAMVREGMAFLERTMPLGARFPEGRIFREDRFPVPLNALREILLNAVMHRDYSYYAGYIAIAVFDDRIEISSYGCLPPGVTLKQLSGPHLSELRNPFIAEAFHRTGAVEVWGRGTNRVIDACRAHGAAPPTFEERQGFLIVTFQADLVGAGQPTPGTHQVGTKSALSRHQVQILGLCREGRTLLELMQVIGRSDRTKFRTGFIRPLLGQGLLEMTIPDRPNSRLQRYRTTARGLKALETKDA